jgi:hypothetical protein
MTTFVPPRHRGSSFLHRHRSGSISRVNSGAEQTRPTVFEGTDTVTQNRKVAVQRVIEVHDALEPGSIRRSTSSRGSTSSNSLKLDFTLINIPNAEVRTFRHFLRMWDHNEPLDLEFDHAVLTSDEPEKFEANSIKHFFRRIAMWDESEEGLKDMAKRAKKERKKREKDTALGKMWMRERESQENLFMYHNPLTEVTTREGLAQLLWTLMHDQRNPLVPELFKECTEAVKRTYGIQC